MHNQIAAAESFEHSDKPARGVTASDPGTL